MKLPRGTQTLTAKAMQVEALNKDASKVKGEVDAAARKVEEDAAKGKSYLSSWFGSK